MEKYIYPDGSTQEFSVSVYVEPPDGYHWSERTRDENGDTVYVAEED